jgi:nitrous oxide reductase accessory protein NosL
MIYNFIQTVLQVQGYNTYEIFPVALQFKLHLISAKNMKLKAFIILALTVQLTISVPSIMAGPGATDAFSSRARCPVCRMYVADYPEGLSQIHYDDLRDTRFFDGVKDMMIFYFNPEKFADAPPGVIRGLFVKDYNSHSWLSAEDAFYVIGSEIKGPMGDELIPFESKVAAESFLKKHNGMKIITFEDITPEVIDSLRTKQRMH